MFIELVDTLRCLNDHEDTWLVAAVERFEGRYIDRGSLGCPVCRAEYRIERGAADFRASRGAWAVDATAPFSGVAMPADTLRDEVLRVRALLDLREHGGTIVLTGAAAVLAAPLEDELDLHVLVVNPGPDVALNAGRSTLLVDGRVPLARESIRGAVAGEDQAAGAILADLASALRAGGRLVGPASVAVTAGVQELARDDRQWVGVKRDVTSRLVTIGQRR